MRRLGWSQALRLFVGLASIASLVLGCVILFGAANDDSFAGSEWGPREAQYGPVGVEETQRPSALFTGDDFPAGYGGIGRNAYPQIVCYSIGLNCGVDAQPGTGFVNDGREYSSTTFQMIDRLPTDQKLYDPDFVIIDAGRNDHLAEPPVLGEAVARYLRQVKRMWPGTKIVVIAPYYLTTAPDPDHGARISLLSPIVAAQDGMLIDPVAEGWYEGVDESSMLQPDGFHPNQAGHEFLAKKLGESLKKRGIGQSGATS